MYDIIDTQAVHGPLWFSGDLNALRYQPASLRYLVYTSVDGSRRIVAAFLLWSDADAFATKLNAALEFANA